MPKEKALIDAVVEITRREMAMREIDPAHFITALTDSFATEIESEIRTIDARKRELVALKHRLGL